LKTKPLTMSPVIFIVGLVSLLTDLSRQMIVPILPLCLTTVLHVQVGTLGVMEGIAESTASILKLFSGWMTDRVGKRKLLMVVGYGLSNMVKPFFALSASWGQVLVIRFADRFGKGIRVSPREALLADITTKEERVKSFRVSSGNGCFRRGFGTFVRLWDSCYGFLLCTKGIIVWFLPY
jgi:MFS family permease